MRQCNALGKPLHCDSKNEEILHKTCGNSSYDCETESGANIFTGAPTYTVSLEGHVRSNVLHGE